MGKHTPDDYDGTTPLPNPKQERFCQRFLLSANAKQSYIEAGYITKKPDVQGCKLNAQPQIRKRVGFLQSKLAQKTEINAAWVINKLVGHAERAERESDQIKALELIGKHCSAFTDKIQIDIPRRILIKNLTGKLIESIGPDENE